MPIYHYVCEECDFDEEVLHSVKDLDKKECLKGEYNSDCKMRRVPCVTNVSIFNSLTSQEKREVLKKRSKEHFKKNIEESFHQKNKPGYIP